MIPDPNSRLFARINNPTLGLGLGLGLSQGGGVRPAMALNFLSGTLDPRITFTRASSATYVNSSGLIASAAINAPRFDYSPTSVGTALGLLLEEQRTNLVFPSIPDGTVWSANGGTIATNNATSPDGTSNASRFSEDGTNTALHGMLVVGISVGASTTYTASTFLKYIGRQWASISMADGGSAIAGNVWFDIQNGLVGSNGFSTGTFVSASIVNYGNGWYRCSATFTTAAATSSLVQLRVMGRPADNSVASYVGLNAAASYYFGAQLEAGAFATSYIPTTSAQVTRSIDSALMTGTNFSNWFNAAQGTFFAEFTSLTAGINHTDGILCSGNSARYLQKSGTGNVLLTSTDGTTNISSVAQIASGINKAGSGYTAGVSRSISLNGATAVTTNTCLAAYTAGTALRIGDINGVNPLNGRIRQVSYYNQRLSDAQIQALST